MRAALIKAFGEPTEVLELADLPEPSGPAAGEVLIGVEPKIPAALREALPLVVSGPLRAPIAAIYPLSALREAVLHAQRGGKVLLDLREAA